MTELIRQFDKKQRLVFPKALQRMLTITADDGVALESGHDHIGAYLVFTKQESSPLKLDKLGRVTIPEPYFSQLGLTKEDYAEFYYSNDGETPYVKIRKHIVATSQQI